MITDFQDAEEYGSILQLSYTKEELDALDARLDDIDRMADYGNLLVQYESVECVDTIAPLIRQARIMSQKYDVVVTNPPYIGRKGMNDTVAEYLDKNYPAGKMDLFSTFIIRGLLITKNSGLCAMMTPFVWTTLTSYTELRNYIVQEGHIVDYTAFIWWFASFITNSTPEAI